MKKSQRLGAILAIVAALLGLIGHFTIFLNWYGPAQMLKHGEPASDILLKYIMPFMFDLGILAVALYAVSAYGFFRSKSWAFALSATATVLALQGSWFANIPLMVAGEPPVYLALFWPYLLLYFLFAWQVSRLPWGRTLLALATGMAYVLSFMNGVASLNRILVVGAPIFVAVQRLHWVSTVGWGVVTVAILLRPGEWTRVTGLVAGVLELIVGLPLGVISAIQLGRVSMFLVAPLLSLLLIALLAWPGLWERWTGASDRSSAETVR